MRSVRAKAVLLLLGGLLALGLVALALAIGPGSSEADQGAMHNCPQPSKWAISVWSGDDGTGAEQAFATCDAGTIAAAYYLVPEDQTWQRWFAGRPLVSTLETLNDKQGVIALGAMGAPPLSPTPAPPSGPGQLANCPQPDKWAISAWDGPDGTDTGEALAKCDAVPVVAAYHLDPENQTWQRWFAGRPLVSTLETLNDMQGVIVLGAVGAPPPSPTPTPTPTSWREIGVESIWILGGEATITRLHECSRERRTECATTIMQESGASPQAVDFFRMTGWFLGEFQEMGRIDLGSIVNPWLVNENVQYAFLNGTPLVVYPADEVGPVSIWADPNYDELVASFPDLFLWPGLGVFEALSTPEQEGQRFVLQLHLVDGCHACSTGYFARVAFDFGPDGTYLGVDSFPLGLCWGGGVYPPDFVGPRVTPVSASVPDCPLP